MSIVSVTLSGQVMDISKVIFLCVTDSMTHIKGHSVMSAHFTDEKTDFRKGEELAQGPTGDRWSSQGRT